MRPLDPASARISTSTMGTAAIQPDPARHTRSRQALTFGDLGARRRKRRNRRPRPGNGGIGPGEGTSKICAQTVVEDKATLGSRYDRHSHAEQSDARLRLDLGTTGRSIGNRDSGGRDRRTTLDRLLEVADAAASHSLGIGRPLRFGPVPRNARSNTVATGVNTASSGASPGAVASSWRRHAGHGRTGTPESPDRSACRPVRGRSPRTDGGPMNSSWKITTASPNASWLGVRNHAGAKFVPWSSGGVWVSTPTLHGNCRPP